MNVSEWMGRLADTFGPNGVVGERLLAVAASEDAHATESVERLRGHHALMDSLSAFHVETLQLASDWLRRNGMPDPYEDYGHVQGLHVALFRRFRAANILYLRSYGLEAYCLLRDVKDQAIFLGAIMNGATSVVALLGLHTLSCKSAPLGEETVEALIRARKAEQRRVLDLMTGRQSGLADVHVKKLRGWQGLFDREVHGSELTMASMLAGSPVRVVPEFDELRASAYCNCAAMIGWMLLRTLPFLQLRPRAFGDHWAQKWTILDDSFRIAEESLVELGKPIQAAVIALLEAKFAFSPHSAYSEA